mmetsp:Transcript_40096/g.87380  ORF Transcript_40096/g.87380 Transcript_40096/m.87380 type:complete len:116 (+) Transcript_40096:181-528(+)
MNDFTYSIKQASLSSGMPILADADTGFGGSDNAYVTVREYIMHGASGAHFEDQEFPKRCGHLDGKRLVPMDEFKLKISQAKQSSMDNSDGDFVVCARTDAYGVEGLDAAIKRACE